MFFLYVKHFYKEKTQVSYVIQLYKQHKDIPTYYSY